MSDQLIAEAAAYTTHEMNTYVLSRIQTHNPSKRAASNLCLRLHSYQDWPCTCTNL